MSAMGQKLSIATELGTSGSPRRADVPDGHADRQLWAISRPLAKGGSDSMSTVDRTRNAAVAVNWGSRAGQARRTSKDDPDICGPCPGPDAGSLQKTAQFADFGVFSSLFRYLLTFPWLVVGTVRLHASARTVSS